MHLYKYLYGNTHKCHKIVYFLNSRFDADVVFLMSSKPKCGNVFHFKCLCIPQEPHNPKGFYLFI